MSKTTFTTEELANDNGGFDKAIKRTLGFEGGFTVDHAGPTNLGVTQQTYNLWRKRKGLDTQPVQDIDPQEAKQLYKEDYFDKPGFSKLTPDVAGVLFDFGVNAGTTRAAMSLQKAVGASPDGAIGPKTLKNFQEFISKNGEKKLLQKLIEERSRHNETLIKNNPKKFGKYKEGWKNRIDALKKEFDLSALNPFSVKEASADEIAPEDHPTATTEKTSFTTEELFGDNPTDSPKESFTTEELFGKDYGNHPERSFPAESVPQLRQSKPNEIYDLGTKEGVANAVAEGKNAVKFDSTQGFKFSSLPHDMQRQEVQNIVISEGLTHGLVGIERRNPRLAEEHPVTSAISEGFGGLVGLFAVGGATTGIGKIIIKEGISKYGLKELPKILALARVAQTSATFGAKGAIDVAGKAASGGDVNTDDLVGIGEDIVMGAGLGLTGSIAKPLMRIPAETLFGYTTAKMQGADDTNAAVNAAVFGLFGMLNRADLSIESRKIAVREIRNNLSKKLTELNKDMPLAEAQKQADDFILGSAMKSTGETNPGKALDKVLLNPANNEKYLDALNEKVKNFKVARIPEGPKKITSEAPVKDQEPIKKKEEAPKTPIERAAQHGEVVGIDAKSGLPVIDTSKISKEAETQLQMSLREAKQAGNQQARVEELTARLDRYGIKPDESGLPVFKEQSKEQLAITQLEKGIKTAEAQGNTEAVARYQKRIEELKTVAPVQTTTPEPTPKQTEALAPATENIIKGGDSVEKSKGQEGQKEVLKIKGADTSAPVSPSKFNFPKEFTTEGFNKDKHETENGNLYPGVKFKKSVKDFKDTLNNILGWEPDLDKKGKDASVSTQYNPRNSADGRIILWKPGSDLGVYIYMQADVDQDTESANTRNQFMWRVTSKDDKYRGKGNNFASIDITPQDLAEKINKEIAFYDKKDGGIETVSTEELNKFIEEGKKKTPPSEESAILKSEGDQGNDTQSGLSRETPREEPNTVRPGDQADSGGGSDGSGIDQRPDRGPGTSVDSVREEEPATKNYRITPQDLIGEGGLKTKFKQNIAAVDLLKKIESENRLATPEEQKILVKYVGWGGMSQAFDAYNNDWSKEYSIIKEKFTYEERDAARRSTINAHYTSPELINAMWRAVTNMGFTRGNVLEPSAGVGHFVGLAPQNNKKFSIIELDSISGRIAKLLYPDANVQVTGLQEAVLPSNFYGLAISNIPFSDYKPFDANGKKQGLPTGLVLHDYFFAKSLAAVKPGGIVAFITSSGTMDKGSQQLRSYIKEKAKFLGAIRLPSDAFKKNANTQVVTDVIFLQKFKEGETSEKQDYLDTAEFKGKKGSVFVNKYFLNNPDMVLGTMDVDRGLYNNADMVVKSGEDFPQRLEKAIDSLPKDIYRTKKEDLEITQGADIPDHNKVKDNAFKVDKGKLYKKENNTLVEVKDVSADNLRRIEGILNIRDIVRDLLHSERTNADPVDIALKRKKLNSIYDKFSKQYGAINDSKNVDLVEDDPDFALLSSLEEEVKDGRKVSYKKRDIFTKRIIKPHVKPTKASSPEDALKISIGEYGEPNWEYMKDMLGMEIPNIQKILLDNKSLFLDPSGDRLVLSDEYLSGNVKKKLAEARAASSVNNVYGNNINALEKVIPKDLTAQNIKINIGMPWIMPEEYNSFMSEVGLSGKVILNRATGSWDVEKGGGYSSRGDEWQVDKLTGQKIIEMLLNGKPVKVMKKMRDSEGTERSVIDEEQSALAEEKATILKEKFKNWFWENDDRRSKYEKIFNENWNNLVPRKYDGSTLVLPGFNDAALPGPLRSSQLNAIKRGITAPRTMLAHSVGAGKTAIMTAIAMESKRLGISNKSLVSVPKNTIPSWRNQINTLYPAAKVLVADEKNFTKDKLSKFIANVSMGDWDIIVVSHDNLERLQVSPEAFEAHVNEQLDDLREAKEDAKAQGSRISVKNIETAILKLEEKLKSNLDQSKKLDIVYFEEMGIDALYVDEADVFKNLPYTTQKEGIKGMGTPTGSMSAMDLKMKTDILRKINGKIVFATGTPVSNSMVEIYSMMKYLQPEVLEEQGIKSFDAWANTFADPTTETEVDVTGARYKLVTRFKNFMNMGTLRNLIGESWDIQTQAMLIDSGVLKRGDNLPLIKGGKAQNVVLPASADLQAYTATLIERAEAIKKRKGKVSKGDDIMLTVMMDGISAALDMRMIDPTLPANPDSKVEYTIRGVLDKYKEYAGNKGTQIIFIDKPAPDTGAKWNPQVYIKKKLVAGGIPASEIAFIHDADNEDQRKLIYEKMNAGELRVLFGSTEKLGAGTNVQKRLAVLWHLGIPTNYRPRDIIQREGRIDRPGNSNKEIEIYRLAVKGSLDTFVYGLLEAKNKSIEGFMRGDMSMMEMSDSDIDPFEAMKALSSDNPLVKEKSDVDREVKKLQALFNAYLGERDKAQKTVKTAPPEIEALKKKLETYTNFKNTAPKKPAAEEFTITVDGENFTNKKDALESIYKSLGKINLGDNDYKVVGDYLGYPLVLGKVISSAGVVENSIGIQIGSDLKQYLMGRVSVDPVGTFSSLDYAIFDLIKWYITSTKASLLKQEDSLKYAQELLAGKFSKGAELETKSKRQKEINSLLQKDMLKEKVVDEDISKPTKDTGIDASTSGRSIDDAEIQATPQGKAEEIKLFEEVKTLAKKWVKSPVGEGHVPRGLEGSRFRDNGTILVRSMNNLSVMIHEVTHDLFFKGSFKDDVLKVTGYAINGKPIYDPRTKKARKELTEIYVKYYSGGKADHALEKRVTEGYSVLAQRMVEAPALTQREFPYLYAEVVSPGGKYYDPKFAELIKDGQTVVKKYQALSPLQKMGARILSTARVVDKGSFLNVREKVIEQAVDRIYPLEKMAKESGLSGTVYDPSLWARANMTTRYVALENINTTNGYITIRDGEFKKIFDFNWKSLVDNLHKEGGDKNVEDFSYWLVARRVHFGYARLDAMAKTDEGYEELQSILKNDNIDRTLATSAYQSELKRFDNHGKMFDDLIRADLDLLHSDEVQLVDDKRYANLTAQKGYAPFQRDVFNDIIGQPNETNPILRPMVGKNKVSSMMGRSGSDLPIVSPLYGAMMNHMEIMKKANRQIIYNIIGERVSPNYPELFRSLPLVRVVDKESGRMSYPQEKDPNIMMAYVGGKRMPFLVDKEIKALIDELFIFEELHLLEKALLWASNIFVKSTTALYIPFAISNFIVDQFTAVAQTKNNLIPILSQIKVIYKALSNMKGKEAQYFREYIMLGGDRQVYVNIAEMSPEKSFQALLKEKNALDHILGLIDGGAYILSIPSKYSEIWTRGTEYVLARQAGKGQLESLEEAGRVTAPFHHEGKAGGHVGRTYIKSMAYFKARMQVLAQMGRSLTSDKKSQKRALFTIIGLTFANIAAFAYLLNNASDDQKEEYNGIEAKELAGYMFFPHPSGSGFIRIRVPEQMTFLSTAINMMIADRLNNAKHKAKDYVDALTAPLPDQINITDPVRQFLSLWPQIMVPAAGASMNKRIYPSVRDIESRSMQAIPAKYRYYENTSKAAIFLGSKLNISPLKIDFLVEGYLGRSIKGITVKEIPNPLIRKVYLESMRQVQNYYDMRETVDQEMKALRSGLRKEKYPGEEDYLTDIKVIIKRIDSDFEYYRSLKKIDPQDKDLQQLRRDILDGIDSLPSKIKTKR